MGYSDLDHNTNHVRISNSLKLEGNVWNARYNRIGAVSNPIASKDVVTVNYSASTCLNKRTGGSVGGSIDVTNHELLNVKTNNTQDTSAINTNALKKYVNKVLASCIQWSLMENSHYSVIIRSDKKSYFNTDNSLAGGRITRVYDQSRMSLDASANNDASAPIICGANERINGRYFAKFSGDQRFLSRMSSNSVGGGTPESVGYSWDGCHIFVVYRLTSLRGYNANLRSCVFSVDGQNGVRNYQPFLCFSSRGDTLLSGTFNDYIVIQDPSATTRWLSKVTSGRYQKHANPSVLNKWVIVSIHMDRNSTSPTSSHFYCNGVKLTSFRANISNPSMSDMVIGDISNRTSHIGFNGDIGYFNLMKGQALTEVEIKTYHYSLSQMFHVTTQDLDLS